ncbi:MAG: hypothetical protein ABIW83_02755 [Allosphingosinicella sp.]
MVDNRDLAAVREYFHANKAKLIECFGAVGAGIGREPAGESSGPYVIVLYLPHPSSKALDSMELEGIEVKFEVTGQFRKLHLD